MMVVNNHGSKSVVLVHLFCFLSGLAIRIVNIFLTAAKNLVETYISYRKFLKIYFNVETYFY
jgi:hypothetical protein